MLNEQLLSDFGSSRARFRSHHVDGPLLLLLDDQDLRDELGVASRLLRKRILSTVSRLS